MLRYSSPQLKKERRSSKGQESQPEAARAGRPTATVDAVGVFIGLQVIAEREVEDNAVS